MIYLLIWQHFCNCCIFYATKVMIFGISIRILSQIEYPARQQCMRKHFVNVSQVNTMRGSDRTEKHFLHLVRSLKIEYKRLKHDPHGNKTVGANTVRPSCSPVKPCVIHTICCISQTMQGSDAISVSQKWTSRLEE